MQIKATQDINAPIDCVFTAFTDFDRIEAELRQRNVTITRRFDGAAPMPGAAWEAQFQFQGKDQKAEIVLTTAERPKNLRFEGAFGGIRYTTDVTLEATSESQTQGALTCTLAAKSLSGKLLLQGLKLAKPKITERLQKRLQTITRGIENGETHQWA